jgi:hypothetical protein
MRPCLAMLIALLFVFLRAMHPLPAYACSIDGLLLNQLIERGEWIVEGTVGEVFGDGYGAEVQVSLVYRGALSGTVTVNPVIDPPRTFLDPVHGWVTEDDDCADLQAAFVQGEQVMLFLRQDPVRGWTTLGMRQGKVTGHDGAVVGKPQNWPQEWTELQAIVTEGVSQEPSAPAPVSTEEPQPLERPNTRPPSLPLGAVLIGSAVVLAVVALAWERMR